MSKRRAPKTAQPLKKRLHLRWRRFKRSILIINDTPHRVALGMAIGTFVAYQPIVGLQMVLGAILALISRANVTATVPPAWITNPVTIIPIYLGLHWIGNLFVGGPALHWEQLKRNFQAIQVVRLDDGLWSSLHFAASEFAVSIIWPMAIGGAIVGILNGLLFYWLTYRAISAYQHHKMLKRVEWITHHPKPDHIANVQPHE